MTQAPVFILETIPYPQNSWVARAFGVDVPDDESSPSWRRINLRGDDDMARQSAAEKKAARKAASGAVGHNAYPKSAYDEYLDRLHVINDRLDEDSATHKADMKKVYDDMAGALDMPVEVCQGIYKADRREIKAQKKAAKMDSRARSSYLRLAEAYGNDSPLGQYAARMAKAAGGTADANKAEDAEEGEAAELPEEAAAQENQE